MPSDKSLMIRLSAADKKYLQQLSKKSGKSMTKIIEQLLEDHRRRSFFVGLASDHAKLSETEDEQQERDLWDRTAADGLEDE